MGKKRVLFIYSLFTSFINSIKHKVILLITQKAEQITWWSYFDSHKIICIISKRSIPIAYSSKFSLSCPESISFIKKF